VSFEPSPARRGLDWLLASLAPLDLISAEWQLDGPWLLVVLGQQSDDGSDVFARHPFAIFKATGAVHGYDPEHPGAVTDDPLFVPGA
jgi:hypothetical protein